MDTVRDIQARLAKLDDGREIVVVTVPGQTTVFSTVVELSVPESQRLLMQLHSIDQMVRGGNRKPTLRERIRRWLHK